MYVYGNVKAIAKSFFEFLYGTGLLAAPRSAAATIVRRQRFDTNETRVKRSIHIRRGFAAGFSRKRPTRWIKHKIKFNVNGIVKQ